MNDNFEELIHDGIDQLTAGSALPLDLAARARHNVRRRRYQIRAAVAGGTAVAAAVAVIAATSAGSAGTAQSPSIALLAKVERAVASKAGSGPVLQIKTVFNGGQDFPTFDPFSSVPLYPGGKARAEILWARGNTVKFILLGAKNQIVTATRSTDGRKPGTTTTVDYASRTWWRHSLNWITIKPIHTCLLLPFGPTRPRDWSPGNLAKEIKHAIACGRAKVAGRQQVDGVNAIKLTFSSKLAFVYSNGRGWARSRQIMWVDPHSYLPLRYRSTLTFPRAKHGSGQRSTSVQSDFRWLAATKPALAKLLLTVPGGFRPGPGPIIYAPLPRNP